MSTITLSRKPKASESERKTRTGSRARAVAMRQIQAQKYAPKVTTPTSTSTSSPHSNKAASTTRAPKQYFLFATCPQGIEEILCQELIDLGFEQVTKGKSGCHFRGTLADMMRANLCSRLATRILLQLGQADVRSEDDLYAFAYRIRWEKWFGASHTLRVDTSAIRSPMKSLQFCNLRVKDAICDYLRDVEGARPSIDTVRPDAKVQLFLQEDTATLYLDTSGESLFKRGWRLDKGEAPLRENLAAALITLAGWDKQSPLFDPFCGSGTILIEAAYMAQNVPPGILRMFGFERLRTFDKALWREIQEEASSQILTKLEAPLFGSDIHLPVLEAARQNQDRARLSEITIRFEQKDALLAHPPTAQAGVVITNPPYGERLQGQEDLFWQQWGSTLKHQFAQWQIYAITSDLEITRKIRLRPRRKIPLYNGTLDCRLFCFDMVDGKHE